MKIVKTSLRLFVGIVFTFSGFVKAIDPLGFGYMISDYFTDAFGMPSLSAISLVLSVLLNALELLVGLCLIINVKPRLAALGALLFMVIYTPLTLYIAIANPVSDCGCFGDAIKLTNWQTFFKNVVLLPMTIYLLYSAKGSKDTYKPSIDWSVAVGVFAVSVLFQVYSLNHLPIMDFRPYKVGTYIPDKMIMPKNEKPDSFATVIQLRNVATDKVKEVDEATYMSNEEYWDETKWIADTTMSVLIEEGYKPPIYNFKAYPVLMPGLDIQNGGDMMDELLANNNFSFFVISYDLALADMKGFDKMTKLINYAYQKEIKAELLTSTTSDLINYKTKIKFPVRIFNCDAITLKTIVRSNPGLLLMKQGKIIGKWNFNDVPSIEEFEKIIKKS